jgi:alpha-tubulin suppressor-like RCC1 family protein
VVGVPSSSIVTSGAGTSCAVTAANDAVTCWGNNKFATSGNPNITTTRNFPPSAVALNGVSNITQLVMGNAHACVVASGRVHCWGQNNAGQIGGTPGGNVLAPVEVTSLAGQTHLTAGGFNLCAYTPSNPDGALVCMGINTEGQLGIGTNDLNDHPTPSSVGDLKDIASASIGGNHGCAVARRRTDPASMPRRVFCWGKNTAGQVIQPASQRILDPVEIALPPK